MQCKDRWMEQGFTPHSTQNSSFWRGFPKTISWLGIEKTKPNTTKKSKHSPINLSFVCQSKERQQNTRSQWRQKMDKSIFLTPKPNAWHRHAPSTPVGLLRRRTGIPSLTLNDI